MGADWYRQVLDWANGGAGDRALQHVVDDTFPHILKANDISRHFDDWCVSFTDYFDNGVSHAHQLDPVIRRAFWQLKQPILDGGANCPNLIRMLQNDVGLAKLRLVEQMVMGNVRLSSHTTGHSLQDILSRSIRAIS